MTKHNQQIGAWGEQVAADSDYLVSKGLEIMARNVRRPYAEIDIIARPKDVTAFVEVKTLSASQNFFPEHNITPRQREPMLACAQHYSAENEIDHWQIGAIEGKPGQEPVITYFENAI